MSHFSAANSNTQQFTEFHDGLLSAYRADVFDADISMQSAHSNRSTSDPQLSTPKSYKGQDYLDALRALPELRPIPWKPGHELPLEKTTEHTRVQTRGAFLLVTRGKVRDPPCTRCSQGIAGRFTVCVSLEGWFKGACATCENSTRGNHCSLRLALEGKEAESKSKAPTIDTNEIQISLESPHREAESSPNSSKRRRESPPPGEEESPPAAPDAIIPPLQMQQPQIQQNWPSVSNSANAPTYPLYNKYRPRPPILSHYAAAPPSASAYTPNPALIPSMIQVSERLALLDYVSQKQNPPNGMKRHHQIHRAKRDSQEPSARVNGSIPYTIPAGYSSASQSPNLAPTQMQFKSMQYAKQVQNAGPIVASEQPEMEVDLIDTFPRKKQKQIFSIIGGLQSGIRAARQQAEDMQKQLDLLQEALGIGVGENEDS